MDDLATTLGIATKVEIEEDPGFRWDYNEGYDETLTVFSRFFRIEARLREIETALLRLEKAGILYHVTMIPGLGGRYLSWEHAVKTAALLSRLHPETIWCLSLKLWERTPLYRLAQRGEFDPLTPIETLLEEREMVSRMNMTHTCRFIDSTVLQKYTISANLPKGKTDLLRAIDHLIAMEGYPRST